MSKRVLYYVQSLLGVGHVKRASLIAGALRAAGFDVTVVLGGAPVPGITFDGCSRVLLPAVRTLDATFSTLVDTNGQPIDDAFRDRRAARLLQEFDAIQPQALLIEMFPFGRGQFRFELLPLLQEAWARPDRPCIVSSVRDVLIRKAEPQRNQAIIGLAKRFFDRVLVHGDPEFIPLTASFPEADAIADKLIYTGYVAEAGAHLEAGNATETGRGEVVVMVGGGAVGEPLLRTALEARPLSCAAGHVWRLLTGPNLPERAFDELRWTCPDGVVIERWRDDVPELLANAALCISQAGYNTMMDVLSARVPAVVVPFATPTETEQGVRAGILAERGAITLVAADDLSPKRLAAAIDEALTRDRTCLPLDMHGAEATARAMACFCAGIRAG
ncbi:MAG: glycosyltransferase [Defluviicoccus sp.]|nr:glycosyltransferase [Defluviicoccus sp.]MDG4608143.1 glycosyltransferase [Defluviicoccus sp.]